MSERREIKPQKIKRKMSQGYNTVDLYFRMGLSVNDLVWLTGEFDIPPHAQVNMRHSGFMGRFQVVSFDWYVEQ